MPHEWLPEFIADRLKVDDRLRGRLPDAPSDGLMLMGTLGYASYLFADGSVWIEQDTDWTGLVPQLVWRRASLQESYGQLNVASKKFPELLQLLPPLPLGEPPCPQCAGGGELRFANSLSGSAGSIICDHCLGLGWRVTQPGLALADVPWRDPWAPTEPGLERQLAKELSFAHPLYGKPAVAVARRRDSDDVLFQLSAGPARYAEVHLTWSHAPDGRGRYPLFRLYDELSSWLQSWDSNG